MESASKRFQLRFTQFLERGVRPPGITKHEVQNYSKKGIEPKLDTAEKIARAYGMSLGEFLGDLSAHSKEACIENARQAALEGLKKSH